MTITPVVLASIAGVVLSLAFSYIPGLNVKFAALEPTVKRLIMLGLLAVVAGAVFGLGCVHILVVQLTCDQAGAVQLVFIFISAVMANQAAFVITPQVVAAKLDDQLVKTYGAMTQK